MVDSLQSSGNTPEKFQIKTNPKNTEDGGKVNNAQTKQTINIFSSYDKNKDETIKGGEVSNISIFTQKGDALEGRLKAYQLTDSTKNVTINGNTAQSILEETVKNKLGDFATKVNNYTFGVGKLVRQIMVKEGKDADSQKLQIEQQGSAQLDNKVDMDATQKANSYMSDIEDAYKKALDEFREKYAKAGEEGVTDTDKNEAHSDHNTENDDNATVKKVEVFSDYDGNADKHVTYGEIDGAGTFKYSSTQNFGIEKGTQYGQFLDEASNYDVEANFNRYATGFDAKVGSTKLKEDKTNEVQAAKAELNTKATREAEKFNEEITLKVQKEKFEALDKAIKASSKDPSKYDNYIKGLEEEIKGEGAVPEEQVGEKTNLPENYKPTSPTKTEGYQPGGNTPAEKLLNGTLDKLFDFITPNESDSESKVKDNETFDKNKFERYKKMGLSMTLASYMADSANGVTPAGYSNGKITSVSVTGADGQKVTMSVEDLEKFIIEQRATKQQE